MTKVKVHGAVVTHRDLDRAESICVCPAAAEWRILMAADSENIRIGRDRLRQVFGYLKALNEHRNPAKRQIKEQPWSQWFDDIPDHPSISVGTTKQQDDEKENDTELSDTDSYVLKVRRPRLSDAPKPPAELRMWLHPGWEDPENQAAQPLESKIVFEEDSEVEHSVEQFDDDVARVDAFEKWNEERERWRLSEIPARQAMKVFERLYELHGRLEREAERLDLVLGDGILSWKQEEGSVFHPVLIQRVQLSFDPRVPEFTVADTDYGIELYTSLFQSIAEVDPVSLAACRDELEAGDYHPLADESSAFLKRFAVTLGSQGEFTDFGRPGAERSSPLIGRAPVLFLRSRTLGFSRAIESVIERVESQIDFCGGLLNVVGVDTAPSADDQLDGEGQEASPARSELPDSDVLFGKAANLEQIRIAQRLEKHGSVLVQGPPGTGKSHTIANLIGHLLAQQKSVLVTSHTTKALRVLRDHVVEELRPLCVSVLESDLDSRKQLEDSVQSISTRLSDSDADALETEGNQLAQARQRLIDRLESLQSELLSARTSEYRDVVVAGTSLSPSQAARKLAEGADNHDWIPGPVALGEPLPLSPSEVIELYATNGETRPDDDTRVSTPLPEPDDLFSPEEFEEKVRSSGDLAERSGDHNVENWKGAKFTMQHLRDLPTLAGKIQQAVAETRELAAWQLAALDAGRSGGADREPWEHLLGKIQETVKCVADARLSKLKHAPDILANDSLGEQLKISEAVCRYLQSNRKLSWFTLIRRPSWRNTVKSWQVRGKAPETAEHFAAINHELRARIATDDLALLWDGLMACHGVTSAGELGESLEEFAGQYSGTIHQALDWWKDRLMPLIEELQQLGFNWDRFLQSQPPSLDSHGATTRVINAMDEQLLIDLEATTNHLRSLYLKSRLQKTAEKLKQFDRPEVGRLREALSGNDVEPYRDAHSALVAAIRRHEYTVRRHDLLGRLERQSDSSQPIAEAWASHIRSRLGDHGRDEVPGDPLAAWEWAQINEELDRRNRLDIEAISEQIEQVRDRLSKVTIELIDRRAWAGQVRRTSLPQKQALMGWLDTVRRIGRGYGKRVPRLRAEAQKKMVDCRDAVPVWIMPLTRLVENFDFQEASFDVVIIDEASQCDVMALLALALAKQVVVVGDHEQVSPSAVGQKVDQVEHLIQLHLDGIPNSHLYDGKMSVYDLARQSFGGNICLLEHFRCVPDIIQFSNHLSYEGNIKPLRDAAGSKLARHVVPYRVEASESNGRINRAEALAIASLIAAATECPAYKGLTFGVISLVGDDQALEIERLLRTHLSPEQFETRRIVCGNSAQFQGDERDVMFLSVVNTPQGEPLPIRQQPAFQQRFNVAASRAKNQMWVVYSLSPGADLKPGDLRRRLIEHALDPKALTRELDRAERRAESEFERRVIRRLVDAGYKVTPQWQVGRYRIDIVVEGPKKKLAVECDGDRFHPIEKLPDDMARQAILERLGWTFHRIRGSEFYRDPDTVIQRLFAKLDSMDIGPANDSTAADAAPPTHDEPTEFVVRRAAEIRMEWEVDTNENLPTGQADQDSNGRGGNRSMTELLSNGGPPDASTTRDRKDDQVQ